MNNKIDPGFEREEQALNLIRDWTAYLRARRTLAGLDRRDPDYEPIEANGQEAERRQAQQFVRMLTPERRRLFEAALNERRTHWRAILEGSNPAATTGSPRLVDPDAVDQHVVDECLQLVEGREHPNGAGYVRYPAAATDPVTWYDAHLPQLTRLPDDAAYGGASTTRRSRERMGRVVAGLALIPLLAWLVWTLVIPDVHAENRDGATLNERPITGWASASIVVLGDGDSEGRALQVVDGRAWPTDGAIYQRAGVRVPIRVCLPANLLEAAHGLELQGGNEAARRQYTFDLAPQAPADLVAEPCDGVGPARQAALQHVDSSIPAAIGQTQAFGDQAQLQLRDVSVVGSNADPSLPHDVAAVVLEVDVLSATGELDWVAAAPQVRVADGKTYSGPIVEAREGGVSFRYVVAMPREPLDAEWRAESAAGVARWAFTLDVPPDRSSTLDATITVRALEAHDANTVQLVLENISSREFALRADDIRLEQSGIQLETPLVGGLDSPLAAGEQRSLLVEMPHDVAGQFTMTIGSQVFGFER